MYIMKLTNWGFKLILFRDRIFLYLLFSLNFNLGQLLILLQQQNKRICFCVKSF